VAANTSTKRRRLTQQERVAESAARLLEAAIELIAEQGFDRTTAAEIAERAGYSREMVRVRYGSKEAMLESIFGSELDRRLLPPEDEDLTGLTWMLSRIDHVLRLLEEEPQLMRAFCVMSFEAAGPVPALRPWYSRWLADYERQIAAHLKAGVRDRTVRKDVDAEHVAADFVLHGIGLVFRWTLDPDGFALAGRLRSWRARLASELAPAAR